MAVFIILDFNYFWANLKFDFSPPPAPAPQTASSTNSGALPKIQPNFLVIDSLNVKVPVIYINQANEKTYQAALINGVVHFPGTASPGQLGNCYIFGHSSDFIWSKGHYKSIFAVLPKIQKGAVIVITDGIGQPFTYLVTGTAVVDPNDVSVLNQEGYKKKLLTLQTSWPVGTALKRFVVKAELKNP